MASVVRVGFVGSGAVNFGGAEGPWDHSKRLQLLAKQFNLHFVGVADPLTEKAKAVVDGRLSTEFAPLYKECGVYDSHQRMMAEARPDVVSCNRECTWWSQLLRSSLQSSALVATGVPGNSARSSWWTISTC